MVAPVLNVVALVVLVVVVVAVALVGKVAVAGTRQVTLIEVRKLFACSFHDLIPRPEETTKKLADPDENMIVPLSLPARRDDNYRLARCSAKFEE